MSRTVTITCDGCGKPSSDEFGSDPQMMLDMKPYDFCAECFDKATKHSRDFDEQCNRIRGRYIVAKMGVA